MIGEVRPQEAIEKRGEALDALFVVELGRAQGRDLDRVGDDAAHEHADVVPVLTMGQYHGVVTVLAQVVGGSAPADAPVLDVGGEAHGSLGEGGKVQSLRLAEVGASGRGRREQDQDQGKATHEGLDSLRAGILPSRPRWI